MKTSIKHTHVCTCPAYKFPHRPNSGKCEVFNYDYVCVDCGTFTDDDGARLISPAKMYPIDDAHPEEWSDCHCKNCGSEDVRRTEDFLRRKITYSYE